MRGKINQGREDTLDCVAPVVQCPWDCGFSMSELAVRALPRHGTAEAQRSNSLISFFSCKNKAETSGLMFAFADRHGR
jgi:hypothetical protein